MDTLNFVCTSSVEEQEEMEQVKDVNEYTESPCCLHWLWNVIYRSLGTEQKEQWIRRKNCFKCLPSGCF